MGDWDREDDDDFVDYLRKKDDVPDLDVVATAWVTVALWVAVLLIVLTLEALL